VIYYTRLIAYRSLSFVTTVHQYGRTFTNDVAAELWQLDVKADPSLSEHPQIRTCLAVLLVASLVFAVVAAFLFAVREFYVKTPEKA